MRVQFGSPRLGPNRSIGRAFNARAVTFRRVDGGTMMMVQHVQVARVPSASWPEQSWDSRRTPDALMSSQMVLRGLLFRPESPRTTPRIFIFLRS